MYCPMESLNKTAVAGRFLHGFERERIDERVSFEYNTYNDKEIYVKVKSKAIPVTGHGGL
jgi:hypothetical protein